MKHQEITQSKILNKKPSKKQVQQNSITPTITQPSVEKNLLEKSRSKKKKRVIIENDNLIGSLSLKGALIDDISFKKHKLKVDNNENIIFLNPPETENGFFIETGWTSIGNKIKVPTKETVWSVRK